MAVEKKTFLFNKKNGVMMVNLTESLKRTPNIMEQIDMSKFDVKEVEFDNDTHYWQGDYKTGSVKAMVEGQVKIKETEVNYAANIRVLEEYPIHKQLNIIIEMLDQSDIPNTEKFTALKDHIATVKAETKEQKKVYTEDSGYDYVTIKDELAIAEKIRDI